MSFVIKVENLSKFYQLGLIGGGRLADDLNRWWARVRGKPDPLLKIGEKDHGNRSDGFIWALRDINFEVMQGEVLGIIGRNGAGKSTLLKILSHITAPTSGSVKIKGRIGALLEVGTGFHPELTGRENIFLNGAILGMTKAEVTRKFDEIVEFSGVEQFIDTPVKRYSSGMKVRLAFAVAAHLDPEILVIDEVLAVGDAEFQKKCLGKMGDVAHEGRTVLFVSHNMGAVRNLCASAILLNKGKIESMGETEQIIHEYVGANSTENTTKVVFLDDPSLPICFQQAEIVVPGKKAGEPIEMEDQMILSVKYIIRERMKGANLAFALKRDGVVLFRSWDIDSDQDLFNQREIGIYSATIELPKNMLTPGMYHIDLSAGRSGISVITRIEDCLSFTIENHFIDLSHKSHSRGGFIILPVLWNIKPGMDNIKI